jgi:tetratricopeptide (TPR) repeat protein
VDADHPWLGLVSFTEETRGYFHGREEEAAELGRRVQRKLLTVLFGQSGLGKTSILQAGLVPRLRPEGFCPVYVRLDYDPHSPPPSEQIKRAVFRATLAAGSWTQSGSAVSGESLWEFLHHRDDILKDATGRTLIPILIFDQFEEIFTLAQTDDAGRKRAQEFLADLADLVENRPPAALEARIDRDEADAAKFDFARADYRILISLREDYLAHLEGLKAQMPSVTQNRMRLARMTGAQAVAAVRAPAPQLVSEPVAEAIVRFVAGGTDLARAEVEPSLLSLICRELNNTRLARGQAEISADLLAGSRDTILSEFYERTLADQPAGVRVFIEDELLTESGFRESVAEERVRKGFAAAGAAADAVAKLVDRRLLRVEDRLDLRRVEITHDVLCSVIGASRTVRHERDALEASRRELAAQWEREQATRRALKRARRVAAVAVLITLAAIGGTIFGWVSQRRARAAEQQAAQSRELAEQARGEAEKLVGFLIDDFYEELRPTGRVEIVGTLADKAVAYYDGLPPALVTPQTRLYRGMAMVRKATALVDAGKDAEGAKLAAEARKVFEDLRAEGHGSDEATVGLALTTLATVTPGGLGDTLKEVTGAVELLRPLVQAGRASRSAKLAFADLLQFQGHAEPDPAVGAAHCEESRQVLAAMGAADLKDLTAASVYGDVTDSESRMVLLTGKVDEADRLAGIVSDIAEKVLQQRPGDLRAMRNRYFAANMQGNVARNRNNLADAEQHYEGAEEAAKSYVRFNPADSLGWIILGSALRDRAANDLDQGRVAASLRKLQEASDLEHDPRNKTGMNYHVLASWQEQAILNAQLGNLRSARAAIDQARRTSGQLVTDRNFDAEVSGLGQLGVDALDCYVLAAAGDYAGVHRRAVELNDQVTRFKVVHEGNADLRTNILRHVRTWMVESAVRQGSFEEASTLARQLLDQPLYGRNVDRQSMQDNQARLRVGLGQALLGDGKRDEALKVLRESEAYYRRRKAEGAATTQFRQELAGALYQLARAELAGADGVGRARGLLDEAAAELDGLTAEARQLHDSKELIEWVRAAQLDAARRT